MRLVLDTNVVASALLWGGTPRLLLQAGRVQQATLYTSPALLAELSDILGRQKFGKKIAASGFSVDELVARYAELASVVRPQAIAPTILNDPDDDEVLACALTSHADLIISGDHHLLDLGCFAEMPIVTVAESVRRMGLLT
jgi:putative PIN family toxin of toxin-antitoxin system